MVAQYKSLSHVKIASTDEEREAIFRFRYRVYIEEMNQRPAHADHRRQQLCDPHDRSAVLFYIREGDEVVASVRRNFIDLADCPPGWCEAFALDRFAGFAAGALTVSSRFVIAHRLRHSTIAARLVAGAYRHSREAGVRFDFLLCRWYLIDLYEHLGYRRYLHNYRDPNEPVGLMTPMVCVPEDAEYLRSVGSPFARVADGFPNDITGGVWLFEQFPQLPEFSSVRSTPLEGRWSKLRQILGGPPEQIIRMLRGLSEVDAKALLKHAILHRVRVGRVILQPGDQLGALFIVVSGTVALDYPGNSDRPPNILSVGECFAAEGLLASCGATGQAVALSEVQLLILPEQTVVQTERKHPQTVCRLRTNLLQEPCGKFLSPVVLHPGKQQTNDRLH
ncbi:cyclic nucleotide-binding domain-containing protein [Gloeobacter violaceus]|nr:cyclic nucleotide-binding domain-containing protein [Gloeobacter violaceus]